MARFLAGTLALASVLPQAFGLYSHDAPSGSQVSHLQKRKDWEGLAYTWLYQFPLPIPPVKTPKL